ncbi:PROTEIN TAR1 [Salix viminalis]|uniref:PROTEIN TAR1 n=1 Tax=Salix viminalis TaxID=40686 RepID=A0A9Q0NI44_SALVM|nr:PROTEIN TAR1 [Salix viminalis]
MCKCRSHETFPLFGLQSSHLNICYYHKDLRPTGRSAAQRTGFRSDRRALLLIGAWCLPRRSGIGPALQRHPFSGLVSAQLGTVTQLPVHPASPVLFTKNGPLGALDSVARLNEAASYPERNFRGNQLLDCSISLSPLHPSQTNDLHVNIAAGLHQSFLWLCPTQA